MSLDYEDRKKRGYEKKTFDLLTILIKSHPMFCHAHDGPKKPPLAAKKEDTKNSSQLQAKSSLLTHIGRPKLPPFVLLP